jgi:hypothetical protein
LIYLNIAVYQMRSVQLSRPVHGEELERMGGNRVYSKSTQA